MEVTPWALKYDCGVSISKKIANRDFNEKELKQLIETGKTDKLSGFKSKAGKLFNATIVLDEDFKTQFDFS